MSRRYVSTETIDTCKHLRPAKICTLCARAELPNLLARLEEAVTTGRVNTGLDEGGGGTPSWELVNVAAMALLQDVDRQPWTDHRVVGFRDRARIILGDAFAAYTPLVRTTHDETERGKPVQCPRRAALVERCPGQLQVHRESDPRSIDYSKPTTVRCSQDASHEWQRHGGGFLKLRVELDAVGHVRFVIDDVA